MKIAVLMLAASLMGAGAAMAQAPGAGGPGQPVCGQPGQPACPQPDHRNKLGQQPNATGGQPVGGAQGQPAGPPTGGATGQPPVDPRFRYLDVKPNVPVGVQGKAIGGQAVGGQAVGGQAVGGQPLGGQTIGAPTGQPPGGVQDRKLDRRGRPQDQTNVGGAPQGQAPVIFKGPAPTGAQGQPPTGPQGAPFGGARGTPYSGQQGQPPGGYQGPPPGGYQGPPPGGYQGPPPGGYQGPPPGGYQGPPPGGYQAPQPPPPNVQTQAARRWNRGERLPNEYRQDRYAVRDWRTNNLSAPPRGYQWMCYQGGNCALVAIDTGIVRQTWWRDDRDESWREHYGPSYSYNDDLYYRECRNRPDPAGVLLGGLIGGLIGHSVGREDDNAFATFAGVIIGGAVGAAMTRDLDCEDRSYAYSSYYRAFNSDRAGMIYGWRNPRSNHRGEFRVRSFYYDAYGFRCANYTHVLWVDRKRQANGRACRQPDGAWAFLN